MPLFCDPQLSWGHPSDRGGWWRHIADFTYRYPTDAMAAARATYEQICAYSKVVLKRGCSNAFDAYAKDVDVFVQARTKKAKRQWFEAHGFKDVAFLSDTNLWPGWPGNPFAHQMSGSKSNPKALDDTEESRFMLSFLTDWMTRSDLSGVIKERVVQQEFQYELGSPEVVTLNPEEVARLLILWRSRDHGAVAETLHEPATFSKHAPDTVQSTKELTAPFETVAEALRPLDKDGRPISVATLEGRHGPTVVAKVRLRQAPHDSIFVFAVKRDGRYQVVGISSIVEH